MLKFLLVRYFLIGSVLSLLMSAGVFVYGGFDLQQAVNPGPQILSIQDITPAMFSDFKTTFLRPKVRRICMNQIDNKYDSDGQVVMSASDFCDCYVRRVTEAVTKGDMVYLEQFKEPSPDMEIRMQSARQSARSQCDS